MSAREWHKFGGDYGMGSRVYTGLRTHLWMDFVVVDIVDSIMGNGPRRSRETMIFPIVDDATDYRNALCMVPHVTDHAKALKKIGYEIAEAAT